MCPPLPPLGRRFALPLLVLCVATLARAEEPARPTADKVSYHRDIRPIFQDRCQGCHQPAKRGGGLVMTSVAEMLKGGESGEPGIVPGKPADSQLFAYITSQDGQPPEMPKGGDPLTKDQVELIGRWITEGAADDTPASSRVVVDMDHPPVYTLPPVLTSLDFSPDGQLLAVSGYHEVLLHKADGSGVVARLVGMSERIESAVFSPDGKSLAVTGGSPGRFGEVQIWDVAARKLKLSVPVTYDTIYGASWSHDGTKVAFGCADNTVRAIDASTGKQVLQQGAHTDWAQDTVFSTDSSHLVSVGRDRTMKLTEVATERFVDDITSITPGALKGGLMAVDRHPKKDELLCGGADGVPKVYKMYRTQDRRIGDDFNLLKAYEPMPGRIFDVAFSGDGSRLAAGASNDGAGEVRIYETESGKVVARLADQGGPVYALAYREDGKLIAVGGFDGVVRLYEPETGKLIKSFVPVPISAVAVK